VKSLSIWEQEGRERLRIDGITIDEIMKSLRGIHKNELDQLMCDYICDNNIIKEDEIRVIRSFVKYLKEQ